MSVCFDTYNWSETEKSIIRLMSMGELESGDKEEIKSLIRQGALQYSDSHVGWTEMHLFVSYLLHTECSFLSIVKINQIGRCILGSDFTCILEDKRYCIEKFIGNDFAVILQDSSLPYEACIISLKECYDEAKLRYEKMVAEGKRGQKAAQMLLEPIVQQLEAFLVNKRINMLDKSTTMQTQTWKYANEINISKQVIDFLEEWSNGQPYSVYFQPRAYYLPTARRIYLITQNMAARLSLDIKSSNSKSDIGITNVSYWICKEDDDIQVSSRDYSISMDVSVPMGNYRKASVIGRAMIGQLVGGAFGSIMGAQSAIEYNRKAALAQKNHNPIDVEATLQQLSVTRFYSCLNEIDTMHINTGILSDEEKKQIDDFGYAYRDMQKYDKVCAGEIVKAWNQSDYKQEPIDTYVDWLLEGLSQDKIIQEGIQISVNAPIWNILRKKREAIMDLQNKYQLLKKELAELKGIFSGKKRREIETQVVELEKELKNAIVL